MKRLFSTQTQFSCHLLGTCGVPGREAGRLVASFHASRFAVSQMVHLGPWKAAERQGASTLRRRLAPPDPPLRGLRALRV